MSEDQQKEEISEILEAYAKAVNNADVGLLESLFWTNDPRFSEVENDQPMPFGKERFLEIADWIRAHGKPGDNRQRFHHTEVHLLAPDVAYAVSLRDELNVGKTSRVTLVLLRKAGEWRILHGHFSYVPED